LTYLDEVGFKEKVYDIDKGTPFQGLIPALVSFLTMGTYCENMRNILESVSKLHTDINFYGIDVDTMNDFVKRLGIRAIPTTLIIPLKGSPVIVAGLINTPVELENGLTRMITKPSKLVKL
jgi:hypothetical protein